MCRGRRVRILLHLHIQREKIVLRGSVCSVCLVCVLLQCVFITAVPITKLFAREEGGEGLQCVCFLLLQDLLQSCSRGGRRRVEDMCYERRRAEACVDESVHHALVNAGGREIV
jgi:hypothetical protein